MAATSSISSPSTTSNITSSNPCSGPNKIQPIIPVQITAPTIAANAAANSNTTTKQKSPTPSTSGRYSTPLKMHMANFINRFNNEQSQDAQQTIINSFFRGEEIPTESFAIFQNAISHHLNLKSTTTTPPIATAKCNNKRVDLASLKEYVPLGKEAWHHTRPDRLGLQK